MKSYTESSAQTIQIDPDCHLKNYESLKSVSSNNLKNDDDAQIGAQTKQNNEENIDNKTDDNDSDDSCSTSSSCSSSSSSVDQELELQRRLNPTQQQDFQVLKTELLQWRKREERKIIITARNEEHRSDMKKLLLKKEAHLLRKIDQLRNNAAGKSRTKKIEHVMELMSEPKQWVSNGEIINVDTPETCRARELKAMYDELHEKVDKGKRRELVDARKILIASSFLTLHTYIYISSLQLEDELRYSNESRH